MSKKFLNTLPIEEIVERLYKGEKIFNAIDKDTYARYVAPIGICKFQKKTDELLAMGLVLTLFSYLYFDDLKEDYETMIGCVGWFWDSSEYRKVIGILTEYEEKRSDPFCRNDAAHYANFCPAKKSELKFWGE